MPRPRKVDLLKPEATTPRKEHLNAKLDVELKRRMKVHCADRGITMQDFLTEAIQKALAEAKG